MDYRRLGASGLKLSVLSFGTAASFAEDMDRDVAAECLQAARAAGINYFDTGEDYAGGKAEGRLGDLLAELGWPRQSFLVGTKLFFGVSGPLVNMHNTLNRKYLLQGIDGCLQRLRLDFVDLLWCHRPDRETPLEESVWAMSDIISAGKALYWGISQWPADDIRAAWEIAERHHLRKPIVAQPEYNLLTRERVESEYRRLYDDIGLGLATYGALAWGSLTGKYLNGTPDDSRAATTQRNYVRDRLLDPDRNAKVRALVPIAEDLDVELAALALAWCVSNPDVSTVITGASRPSQIRRNVEALAVVPLITDEVRARIDAALA